MCDILLVGRVVQLLNMCNLFSVDISTAQCDYLVTVQCRLLDRWRAVWFTVSILSSVVYCVNLEQCGLLC